MTSRSTRAAMALVLGIAVLPLQAQEDELRPYVFGGYSHIFDDRARGAGNGVGGHFGAGKAFSHYWDVEFSGFYGSFDDDGAAANRWRSFGGGVDGLFHYARDRRFSPYLLLGAGAVRNTLRSAPGGSSTDPYVEAGLGFFKYFDTAWSDLGLRLDVRGRWSDLSDLPAFGGLFEPVAGLSLVYALGEKTAPADTFFGPDLDHDGVTDDTDLCPRTAAGVTVDDKGCPLDGDRDGVADDEDRCPETLARTRVDLQGCPLIAAPVAEPDSDGDGVADARDRCPNTVARLRVDADGCVRELQTLVLEDVTFASASHALTPASEQALRAIAKGLRDQVGLFIEIAGHTDAVGDAGYNQRLSQQRADSVRRFLVQQGVDPAQLRAAGYGEAQPVADNRTREGRARNRRVEFRVVSR